MPPHTFTPGVTIAPPRDPEPPHELWGAYPLSVRNALHPILAALSGLFLLFAASHPFFLPRSAVLPMVLLAAVTALTYGALYFLLRRRPLPLQWVHPVSAGVSLLALTNSLVHLGLTRDPIQSTNVALVIVATGCFFLSWGWFAAVVVAALGGWLIVAVIAQQQDPSPGWEHFAFLLIAATVLATVVHLIRRRAVADIARLRHQEGRRQAELLTAMAAVQQSETRLRTIVGNAPIVLFALDRDGIVTLSTGTGLRATGTDQGQVAGRSVFEVMHDVPQVLEDVRQVLHGTPIHATREIDRRIFECSYVPVQDEQGTVLGLTGVATDVTTRVRAEAALQQAYAELEQRVHERTEELARANESLRAEIRERRRTEEALRESEERFRILFEHSPDAIVLIDPHPVDGDWRIVDCNVAASRMHGYAHGELADKPFNLLNVRPTEPEGYRDFLEQVAREGIFTGETQHRRKDGAVFWVEYAISFIRLDGRELLLGIGRDVTQRKTVEVGLHYLAEAGALLVASLDAETMLTQLAGLTVPQLADWCAIDLLMEDGSYVRTAAAHVDPTQEDAVAGHAAELRRLICQGGEHARLLQDGESTPTLLAPLVAHGRCLGTIALGMADSGRQFGAGDLRLVQDLANRAALAVANARLYREAQAAIQARDQFLSVAAHELRTPVGTLFGYAQVLRDRLDGAQLVLDADRRIARIMVEQGIRLTEQLNTLLDLSRVETGHFALERHPFDLGVLLRQIVTELQPTLTDHEVLIEPGSTANVTVDGDERHLEQVFLNLLQNAIKYSPAGGTIAVRLSTLPAEVEVAITDPGIGISADELPHLFERYYRAPNGEAVAIGGLGIGLYVVHEIVSRHGGTVEVDSKPGAGSTFTVRLPRSS